MKQKIPLIFMLSISLILSSQNPIDNIAGISQSQKDAFNSASGQIKSKITLLTDHIYSLWSDPIYEQFNDQNSIKDDFLAYHFNVYIKDSLGNVIPDINKNLAILSKKDNLQTLIEAMASYKAERICANNLVTRYGPEVASAIKDAVIEKIIKALETRKNNYQTIAENNDFFNYEATKKISYAISDKYKEIKKENTYKSIGEKALEAGLDNERAEKLVNLVRQKDKDIEAIKKDNSPNINTGFFEMSTRKDPRVVMNTFTESVAKLITKQEYSIILGDNLKPISTKKANEEMQNVLSSYTLTEEQQNTLFNHIEQYYFNEIILKYYYAHNGKVARQKLNGLKYYFEKEYKKLMDSFNVSIKSSKKADNNTYQY